MSGREIDVGTGSAAFFIDSFVFFATGTGSSFSFQPPTPLHPSSTQQQQARSRSHSPRPPLSLRSAQIEGLRDEIRGLRRRGVRGGAPSATTAAEEPSHSDVATALREVAMELRAVREALEKK